MTELPLDDEQEDNFKIMLDLDGIINIMMSDTEKALKLLKILKSDKDDYTSDINSKCLRIAKDQVDFIFSYQGSDLIHKGRLAPLLSRR